MSDSDHHKHGREIPYQQEASAARSILKAILISTFVSLVAYGCTLLRTSLISSHLSTANYGSYSAAVNVLRLFAMLVLLGSDTSLMNFISEYLTLGHWDKAKGYFLFFGRLLGHLIVLILMLSAAIFAIEYFKPEIVFDQFLSHHVGVEYLWLSPFLLFTYFFSKVLRVLKKPVLSQIFLNFGFQVFQIVLIFILLWQHIKPTVTLMIMSYVASYAISLALLLITLKRIFPTWWIEAQADFSDSKLWLKVSTQTLIANFFFSNINAILTIVDKIFDPNPHNAGYISILGVIASFLWLPYGAVQIVYGPMIRPNIKLKKFDALQKNINIASVYLLALCFISYAIFFFFGPQILSIFGKQYALIFTEARYYLFFVCIAVGFSAMMDVMIYGGKQQILAITALVSLLGLFVVGSVIVRAEGLWGAIFIFAIIQLVAVVVPSIYLKKNYNLLPFNLWRKPTST